MNEKGKTRCSTKGGLKTDPEKFTEMLVQYWDWVNLTQNIESSYNTQAYKKFCSEFNTPKVHEDIKECLHSYIECFKDHDEEAKHTMIQFEKEDVKVQHKLLKNSASVLAWTLWKKDKQDEEQKDKEAKEDKEAEKEKDKEAEKQDEAKKESEKEQDKEAEKKKDKEAEEEKRLQAMVI